MIVRFLKGDLIRLLKLTRPEIKPLILATFFLIVGSGLSLLLPQFVKGIVDEALRSKSGDRVDEIAQWMAIAFFFQAIAVSLRHYLFTMIGERIVMRLRKSLFASVIEQEIGFFDRTKTGELMSRLSSDASIIQNTVSANISMALRNLTTAVGGIILLVYTSAKLSFWVLVVIIPISIAASFYGRKIRKLSRQAQDRLAEGGVVAEESLAGIRSVRSFDREDFETNRYQLALNNFYEFTKKRVFQVSSFMAFATIFAYTATVFVLWRGGHLVVNDELTIGTLTSFVLYLLIVAFSIGALAGLWTDFMSATGAAKRVFELLDRKTKIDRLAGEKVEKVSGNIQFMNVSFAYPSRPDVKVLSQINLQISPGELIALVGPSGSGKSTIAALIPRFYDPSSGDILIDGKNLRNIKPSSIRQQIGIVSQEPILMSTSIDENIRYGKLDASVDEVQMAARNSYAHDFIESFPDRYQTLVGERGVQLSGGQKQRVAIARAILKDPSILILDEATSALDAESEYIIQQALDSLMKNRTTIVIAHRLSTVKNADRVVVLDGGKIAQSGTHDELMQDKNGLFYQLVQRQFASNEVQKGLAS